MATKNNVRSFRFSDEVAELLEAQAGENLSAKFDKLVHECCFMLPEILKQIKDQEKQLARLRKECAALEEKKSIADQMIRQLEYIKTSIDHVAVAGMRLEDK